MTVRILIGDCRERMKELADASVDSVVCDPPYHLTSIVKRFGAANAAPCKVGATGAYARASKGFMGQTWDGGDVAFQPELWAEVLRVLKPGGHLVAFSGTRTYHRMVVAIEDAGFAIRDQLAWVYGSGFPKSHDVSKQIDKLAGAEREVIGVSARHSNKAGSRTFANGTSGFKSTEEGGNLVTAPATEAAHEWQGWGTALKPSWEPICLARKPLVGTVARNVLEHGTGALNIDGCRIGEGAKKWEQPRGGIWATDSEAKAALVDNPLGRWPANLIHDGSEEVLAAFPDADGAVSNGRKGKVGVFENGLGAIAQVPGYADSGSAARFFYCAKADAVERHEGCSDLEKGNSHPTVKPVELMRWLCRLVTPKGGTVLDPFMGSGSTLIAADAEQFHAIGCELSPAYAAIAERRVRAAAGMFAEVKAA